MLDVVATVNPEWLLPNVQAVLCVTPDISRELTAEAIYGGIRLDWNRDCGRQKGPMRKAVVRKFEKTLKESRNALYEACLLLRSRHFQNLRPIVISALIVCNLGMGPFHADAVAQPIQHAQSKRQIVRRAEPDYPELARRAKLRGNVRLQVKVGADGSVASVQALGGNPIFIKAGMEAIKQWRWERASGDTEESVQLTFGTLERPDPD